MSLITHTSSYDRSYRRGKLARSIAFLERPFLHRILWGICVALIFSYIYFITGAIRNGVALSGAEFRMASLNNETTKLEYTYLSLANNVDLREAYIRGVVDSPRPLYVYVTSGVTPALSLSR